MSDFEQFKRIRKAYAEILPGWMREYESTGQMWHDPYFMNWHFSPIEQQVWCDIRSVGVPFFPQVPALNYFLDFACPFLKIGIECDGKAWHDYDLDKARDARLAGDGWMIFRIEGHECNRVIEPFADFEEDEDQVLIEKYFMTTSEGVVSAIRQRYFDDEQSDRYSDLVNATLFEHRSTPNTYPSKRHLKQSVGPRLVSDVFGNQILRMIDRAGRGAA